jgi:ATP-dependent exoDNAse (exonuclease V) alpha subunit
MRFGGIKTPTESEVTTAVRAAVAENAQADAIVDKVPEVEVVNLDDNPDRITGYAKLSKLIDDDFPFDESQLDAIDGLCTEQYACLTGAAGTGKTTTTKKIVDRMIQGEGLRAVNMEKYWSKGYKTQDADDEYEAPEKWVPSVAMCAFTGRATQMTKKNFPRDWHGNIMTIHRMLGFYPEFFEEWDDESEEMRKKMRFVPTYNADFRLPWDIIIIDEAGMLGLDLWHQLEEALKPGCRVIMIGDINQLPPVHGKSIFGYAMCKWPAWELTHVHRQQGVDNEIVDNAWRILNGYKPESKGRFIMVPLKGDAQFSSRQVRAMIPELVKRERFDPIRDAIITPINGEDGARGFALGQLPLNREFALIFNPQSTHPRYIIDGGRERKQFAVGDKVMATKNDWEAGITNGMTGIITEIAENAEYGGEKRLFGLVETVNKYLSENPEEEEHIEFDLDELNDSMLAMEKGAAEKKEKRERGPSSHTVTVRFGDEEHGFELPFYSLAEVGSLMTAYVVTCHKMQGGEAPVVVVICHDAHRAMLYREWLYTAVTRASEQCILLYKEDALRTALNKQKMKGSTLKQKVLAFNEMQNITLEGFSKEVRLPESTSTRNKILEREDEAVVTPARLTTEKERSGGLMALVKKQQAVQPHESEEATRIVKETVVKVKVVGVETRFREEKAPPVEGGDITPKPASEPAHRIVEDELATRLGRRPTQNELGQEIVARALLPAPKPTPKAVPLPGVAKQVVKLREIAEQSQRLIGYTPAPVEIKPAVRRFGVKKESIDA